ncbi:hypothetical protein GTP91_25310 [Rugamonas sp. FT82W]|uniref:Uncharacterized protein n=1 Tax=Duganella vulcania TaxID=2692166 RepID=A0A845GC56_9BURK|nr:hypothetical protein [Duganella vulcania]MYM90478.1 hypothetical protein [Duganella vulcania]
MKMTSSLGSLFGHLATVLPPMLEEDEVTRSVSRDGLAASLAQLGPLEQGETVLGVVERLFSALALLHARSLAQGEWRFNSFSAWLVARSLLETLATDHHTLVDPGYWNPQPPDTDVEQQRALLKRLENGRIDYHPEKTPGPIRFVYVAWAVIHMGGALPPLREGGQGAGGRAWTFRLPGWAFQIERRAAGGALPSGRA